MTKEFGRRDFLKMIGVTGAVGAGAVAASTAAPKVAKAEYQNPKSAGLNIAIKYLDQSNYDLPPYADGSKGSRYDEHLTAFQNVNLRNQYWGGKSWYAAQTETRRKKCREGAKGFSIRDIALGNAVDPGSSGFMDWGTGYSSSFVEEFGRWEDTPENNSKTIKKFGYFVGAGAVGVCLMKDEWWYTRTGDRPIIISDEYTEPEKTETEIHVPRAMKYAIGVTIPLEGAINRYAPTRLGSGGDNYGYSQMPETLGKMAAFIREMGWHAIPLDNNYALSIPVCLDAGLGELGRNGLLISPEFGPMCKCCKLVTDMPLALDKPISFGAANFCLTCGKCAETCPSKSIPPVGQDPSYEVTSESNIKESKKWKVNVWTCLDFWTKNGGGCTVCQASCPYSKPQTWVHDVVKTVSSKTTLFNSIFVKMDDAFGYGQVWGTGEHTKVKPEEFDEWWDDDDTRMFNWKYSRY